MSYFEDYVEDFARHRIASTEALEAEVKALREALDRIYTYCNDTLSGRADGGFDDREWQRAAVIHARNVAREFVRPELHAALAANKIFAQPGDPA